MILQQKAHFSLQSTFIESCVYTPWIHSMRTVNIFLFLSEQRPSVLTLSLSPDTSTTGVKKRLLSCGTVKLNMALAAAEPFEVELRAAARLFVSSILEGLVTAAFSISKMEKNRKGSGGDRTVRVLDALLLEKGRSAVVERERCSEHPRDYRTQTVVQLSLSCSGNCINGYPRVYCLELEFWAIVGLTQTELLLIGEFARR